MKKFVAIFQNTLTGGGRIIVIHQMIKLLNTMDITPDIYTFRINPTFKQPPDLNYKIHKIWFHIRGFKELKAPLLNLIMHLYQKKYNLFINSNNSLLWAPSWIKSINYIHFPREMRVMSKYISLAFPDKQLVSELNTLDRGYYNFLRYIYKFRSLSKNHIFVTNSDYTKSMLKRVYPDIDHCRVEIIYPPIEINTWTNNTTYREDWITTLGRFGEDKRQLEQIEIAQHLPKFQFNIIGYVGDKKSSDYYHKCKKLIRKMNLSNVFLNPDLPHEKTKEILRKSRFFMHNIRNEPFGISTVEAIAAGCIPIVHNSGGQKEIVPIEYLRFNNVHHAIDCFNLIINKKINYAKISGRLKNHIMRYDTAVFNLKMTQLIKSYF